MPELLIAKPSLRWRFLKTIKQMNVESKINAVKSRIEQIKTSDLFNEEERKVLLKTNQSELEILVQSKTNHSQITAAN